MKVHPLFAILDNECPKQVERVFNQDMCDIDSQFLGFTEAYEALSKLIPTHWTVIDIGCAYGAQAWYFRNHALYIGVDPFLNETFKFKNTVHWKKTIVQTCRAVIGFNLKEFFCILNYVPCSEKEAALIRKTFPNLYCYYPHGEEKGLFLSSSCRPQS